MDTQKRIIVWVSAILIVAIAAIGAWQMATGSPTTKPSMSGKMSEMVSESDWTKGAKDSKVTLVEYSDFECPACGYFFPIAEEVTTKYKDKISFTYRHFPLIQHKYALDAAYASEAAGKQGKFWEMYKKIFESQGEWSGISNAKEIFEGFAKELGLDMEQFKKDRDSKEARDAVDHDKETGVRAGVNGTPSFYLNGEKIQNPKDAKEFETLIENAIANSNK